MSSDSPDLSRNEEWTVVTTQLVNEDGPEKQAVEFDSPDTKPKEEDSHKGSKADVKTPAIENKSDSCGNDSLPAEEKKLKDDDEQDGGETSSAAGPEGKVEEKNEDDDEKQVVKENVKELISKKLEELVESAGETLGVARVGEVRDDVSDISSITEILNPEAASRSTLPFLHYINVASERVNLLLTVAAVLAITAVLGLGIVNLASPSTMEDEDITSQGQYPKHEKTHLHPQHHKKSDYRDYPLDDDLLKRARYLHRQLIMCNKHPNHKACLRDGEKWRNQFVDLIAGENGPKILKELQMESAWTDAPSSANTQKLQDLEEKLSMLSKQIENLQAHKGQDEAFKSKTETKPEIPKQAETSTEKSEKNADNGLYQALNEQVQLLKLQNQELSTMLHSLQNKDEFHAAKYQAWKQKEKEAQGFHGNNKRDERMNIIQQVNELQMENNNLRSEIGRLRYSQSRQHELKPNFQPNTNAHDSPPKVTNGLFGKWPEINWTQLVIHLGRTPQGRQLEELGVALSQLLRDLWELNSTLFPSEGASQEDSETQDSLKDIENLLASKWKELQDTVMSSKGYISHHTERMSDLLAMTMRKIYKTGIGALFGQTDTATPTALSSQPHLQNAVSKMGREMITLEEKWNKIKEHLGTEDLKALNEVDEEMDAVEDEEEADPVPHWLFKQSRDQKDYNKHAESKAHEDWHAKEIKNGKHNKAQDKHSPCKDPKKCKKFHPKQNAKNEERRNYVWKADLPKHAFKESRGY